MKEFLSALIISLIVTLTILSLSPPRDPLVSRHQMEECEREWQANHECRAVITRPSAVWIIDWLGEHIEGISAAVTAAATVAVAIFTLYLKQSSDQMWEVSNRQANVAERALTELERPYLFINRIDIHLFRVVHDTRYSPHLEISIRNYGRTPAIITRIITSTRFGKSYGEIKDGNATVGESVVDVFHPLATDQEFPYFYFEEDNGQARMSLTALKTMTHALEVAVTIFYQDHAGRGGDVKFPFLYDHKFGIFIRDAS